MKRFYLTSLMLAFFIKGFCQTTLTEDANYNLNTGKIVAYTAAGQSFFIGHQAGAGYTNNLPIFSAITDNPTGTSNFYYGGTTNGTTNFFFRADGQGYFAGTVGVGISNPLTRLHVVGSGASIDGGNAYPVNGDDLAVQGNTGGRSMTTGAQLEFVIPAATDGTNLWGQARIITIAGNSNSSDATGKMILGTRRMFNKLGTGPQWYYGNDLTIDGNGFVGINTTNTYGYQLAVNGRVVATSMTVEVYPFADYVFNKDYKLPSLDFVKAYIEKNHHLPEIPSEAEVKKDGLNLGEMNKLLLKKVEELTLYIIQLKEQNDELKADQQKQIDDLKQQIIKLALNKN